MIPLKRVLRTFLPLLLSAFSACATVAEKNPAKPVNGTWKITGVDCDDAGEGCRQNEFSGWILEFTKNGELISGGEKIGLYRVSGNTLYITDAGGNSSIVYMVYNDGRMMLTREKGKDLSERLDRVTEKR